MKPPHVHCYNKIRIAKIIILLSVGLLTSFATFAQTNVQQTDLSKIFAHLKEEWEADRIEKVVIVHVPIDRHYLLEFSPSHLDSESTFQLLIRGPKITAVGKALMAKVEALTAKLEKEKAVALRWGFIFLNDRNERICSIYVDRKGLNGSINDTNVAFDSDELFVWAESKLGTILE